MSAKYPSLRVQGGFFSAELLDDVAEGKAAGQKPRDFGFPDQSHLIDQISAAWSDARGFWQSFRRRAENRQEGETGASFTRAQWVIPLFSLLGYELMYNERAADVDGLTFAISHRADAQPDSPPVHVVGVWQSLDRRAESGRPRLAPHSLLQEYLNRTERVWGLVTNGVTLRLLRDSQLLRRQAYLEFDLGTMFNGEHFADFALLFRLMHRSRLPQKEEGPERCLLEGWYKQTIEQGGRVREHLREGVEAAISALANGLLRHPKNTGLRQATESGALKPQRLYEQLLRLIYRLLFLMVTEERNLLTPNKVYRERYSVSRLRRLCEGRQARNSHTDLWTGLQSTSRLFHSEELGQVLEVPPLDGELFDLNRTRDLNDTFLTNREFLEALWHLSMYREQPSSPPRRINYSALDVEELGSVYESLLDLQPAFTREDGQTVFRLIEGTERKTTGSYYTHPELVDELIKNALVPVMEDRLKQARTAAEKERKLLEITVCDPACGSGHFLLAAARRLARELAKLRTGEDEPSPTQYRAALRDVIGHSVYGVDRNPLAVELCRVALWLESHAEGKPLSFLEHRIVLGNSLVGVRDLAILKNGVPDDAFKPVTGDDRNAAKEIKKRNKREGVGFRPLDFSPAREVTDLTAARKGLFDLPDDTPEQVRRKKAVFEHARASHKYTADRRAADLWCTAFFAELTEKNLRDNVIPTTGAVLNALDQRPPYGPMIGLAAEAECRLRFFHWPLEFPEVFARGGFDVLLCNPPWERIKLQQEEFFATRDLEISLAPNAAARRALIQQLATKKPELWREYQNALHDADAMSKHLRAGGQFPLTARGDINTYSVFAERFTLLVRPEGCVGAVLPTGIATDDTTKEFFASLMGSRRMSSFFALENEDMFYFPGIHHSFKYGLMTIGGQKLRTPEPVFTFLCRRIEDTRKPERRFTLTDEDIRLLNPNTHTCAVFRTRTDAELTKRLYRRFPVLVNENSGDNPWRVDLRRIFDMNKSSVIGLCTPDANLQAYSVDELCGKGFRQMYEAKMMSQFDHRYGDYRGVDARPRGALPTPDVSAYQQARFHVRPWYWIPCSELRHQDWGWSRSWLFAYRDIASAVVERTVIASILPMVGTDFTLRIGFPKSSVPLICCLLANFNCLVFDYTARQFVGGTHLADFITKQLPALSPEAYKAEELGAMVPVVCELACTAWDVQAFLDDVWREADAGLRTAIERQWCENREATGGHPDERPEWYTPTEGRFPRPPFKWDEDRRARLRAELDAYYAKLYGLDERDLRYILDPADVHGPDFPGETFRVLKEKETARYGEYRTRRLVLEAWERLASTTVGVS